MTAPNREPVMGTAEVHAIEHLGATYLRNEPDWKDRVVYFGPMGCRTGFYLLLAGEYGPEDVFPLVRGMLDFICLLYTSFHIVRSVDHQIALFHRPAQAVNAARGDRGGGIFNLYAVARGNAIVRQHNFRFRQGDTSKR